MKIIDFSILEYELFWDVGNDIEDKAVSIIYYVEPKLKQKHIGFISRKTNNWGGVIVEKGDYYSFTFSTDFITYLNTLYIEWKELTNDNGVNFLIIPKYYF